MSDLVGFRKPPTPNSLASCMRCSHDSRWSRLTRRILKRKNPNEKTMKAKLIKVSINLLSVDMSHYMRCLRRDNAFKVKAVNIFKFSIEMRRQVCWRNIKCSGCFGLSLKRYIMFNVSCHETRMSTTSSMNC